MVDYPEETIKMGGGLKSSGIVGRDSEDLEFNEDFKNKVKLREGGLGEPPSLREIERFLKVKERLKSLLEDKRKQRGLVYRLGLKKRNSNIDQEIEEAGEEYHQLLAGVKIKTGYSDEEIREYIEGGRAKRVENALVSFQKEIEGANERLGPGKKELYNLLKSLARDKRVQFLMGTALTGTALVTPPSGFMSILTLGLNPEYVPFDFGPMANGATLKGKTFVLRDVLKERRENQKEGLRTVKLSFRGSDDLTEEEMELRDIRIEKVKKEKEEEKIVPKEVIIEKPQAPVEEIVIQKQETEPIIKEEVSPVVEEVVAPEPVEEVPPVIEEIVAPEPVEEVPPTFAVKEAPPAIEEVIERQEAPELVVKEEAPPVVIEEEALPVVVPEIVVVKKEVRKKAVRKERKLKKKKLPEDLSMAQLQEMEEELLTGKPPKEEDKKK